LVNKKKIIFLLVWIYSSLATVSLYAQENLLKGTVYNNETRQPVEFATVAIVETRVKTYTDDKGTFSLSVAEPGIYTLVIRSEGLKTLQTKINISGVTTRDFRLASFSLRGAGVTITAERDIQKVSRYTMTVKDLKEVPASFGDAINALTSLPGVNRAFSGFFGPLVIRGSDYFNNKYYIDDIPIFDPLHYGGLHSVINNNLMSEIDLYASAFPVKYGAANSAVISINTVDDIQEFGGYTDIGAISATALIHAPILKDERLYMAGPGSTLSKDQKDNIKGYTIVSGRIGYLSLLVPIFYELITGDSLNFVPEYWDYQAKAKYYFGSNHSVTLLLMGTSDYLKFLEEDEIDPDEGDDPLLQDLEAKIDLQSHSQGLYYTYSPGEKINNRVILYNSIKNSYQYFNLPDDSAASWAKDYNTTTRPQIVGVKEQFRFDILEKMLRLNVGGEYTLYHFTARGDTIVYAGGAGPFDPADENLFVKYPLDENIDNHTFGWYMDSKITIGGFSIVPGIRSDYLYRTGETTWDPRFRMSYEFPTDTTISVAGGKYSYFFQTNPFIFDSSPQFSSAGDYLKSEKAIHRVAGIEQNIDLFSIKIEGFYNSFYDMFMEYYHIGPDGEERFGMNTGKIEAKGFEIMMKRDIRENADGLFGWVNYTYTRSRFKSGLPVTGGVYGNPANLVADEYGDEWIDFDYEQKHAFKLIAGYRFGRSTISCKFQYYTSFPYTPIVGSDESPTGSGRYVPLYGRPNSSHFDPEHRLDVRYSYKINHSWGYVSWYVEVINIYNYRPKNNIDWDYRYPEGDDNPEIKRDENALSIIPNFGVEVKF